MDEGKRLYNSVTFNEQERSLRKLATETHPNIIKDIALMPFAEVCDLVVEDYTVVYHEEEELGLVRKEDLMKYNSLIHVISRYD